jgi:hypothetical protein
MVNIRLCTTEDKVEIIRWFAEWGCGVPSVALFPPTTFIATIDNEPVASASLIFTNAPNVAMIENVVKSPAFKSIGREALPPLFNYIEQYAKDFGVRHLFINAVLEQVGDRYKDYGFKLRSSNLACFSKEIGG